MRFGLRFAPGFFAYWTVVWRLIYEGNDFLVTEIKTIRMAKSAAFLIWDLNRRLHDVFDITRGASIFVNGLRGEEALKRRLLDLVQPRVLKMVTEVKKAYNPLLKADGHICFVAFRELLLTELGVKAVLILFKCIIWASAYPNELCRAEWLQFLLDYVVPYHFHLYLRVVRDLPKDYLVTHMHRHENGRAKVLA